MICPYCDSVCSDRDRFCSGCGAPLEEYIRKTKGRHWVPILAMAVLIVLGTVLFFVLPSSDSRVTDSDDWFYAEDGVLYFDESRYFGGGQLTVPSEISGQTITAIGEGCFENCVGLTEVILPETLMAIGEDAFAGCISLRAVRIPESVMVIGENAFSGCSALEAVCIYGNIRTIGAGAFANCSKLFYIYFVGNFQDWNGLYSEFINPYTAVFCNDGSYYQGGDPY